MRGQRGWRELAVLGDKINKFTGMIEGLIWSPRGGDGNEQVDDWAFEEVLAFDRGAMFFFFIFQHSFTDHVSVVFFISSKSFGHVVNT